MAHDASRPARLAVLRSRFATEAIARLLESRYGLRGTTCRLIKATIRDTYRVSTRDTPFIFVIYPHGGRPPEAIGAELDLLDHIDARGVTVAPAIRTTTGERLLPIDAPEGMRYGVLFRFLPGRHLDRRATPERARRFGRAIASIHVRADEIARPLARPRLDLIGSMERALDAVATVVTDRSEDIARLRDIAGELSARLSTLPVQPAGYGLIHGDVIASNAQVAPNGDIGVLDFDFCAYGWRAFDIATYLGEARFWGAPDATGGAFVQGYEEIRRIERWERDALGPLEAARHIIGLGTPAEHVNEWGSSYLDDGLFDRMLGVIEACVAELS